MQFISRSRRLGAAALGVTGLGAAAVTLAAFPTVAKGAVAAVTSVSCAVTGSNWCISGNNSSSGIGVIGTSKSGTGLRGASTSQYGLKATSVSGDAILAQTTGPAAVYATGGTNGVYATTANGKGEAVEGSVSGTGVGVYGYSSSGTAVQAITNSGTAVYATSNAIYNPTIDVENTHAGSLAAQFQSPTGLGVVSSAEIPFTGEDGSGNDVFSVDGHGDIMYSGNLEPTVKITGRATLRAFTSNSTRPTVEDTGTAQLVLGAAAVRLDPTFAAAIDAPSSYRVFVTPNGDTHGLFVAAKSPSGFVVRESQGGRSTVTFDYRIVATAAGKAGQHMAIVSPTAMSVLAPRAARPVVTAAKTAAGLPTSAGQTTTP